MGGSFPLFGSRDIVFGRDHDGFVTERGTEESEKGFVGCKELDQRGFRSGVEESMDHNPILHQEYLMP